MFEAGGLIWRLQTAGEAVFLSTMRQVDQVATKAGQSTKAAGEETERAGKKAETAAAQTGKLRDERGRYIRTEQDATKATAQGGKATEEAARSQERAIPPMRRFLALTEEQAAAARRTSVGLIAVGVAMTLMAGVAVARSAQFDAAMSNVEAATHETEDAMDQLGDAALEAGARTVFSATESAAAIEELAKAGVSTRDILDGGLDGALDLAAAGGIGVADAAGIAAVALKTFNLQGRDMAHVSDLLAAGAGKAMGDVSDLSQALAQGGQVANSTGLSIEETTAALSAFAAQGLIGSDAGTSFKSMLQRLTPQSGEARRMMNDLGISAYDASGQFVGLAKFSGSLQTALRDLTPEQRNAALATIFGSDAVRAATVLYSEGEEGIRDWISAVDDQGYAALTAAARLDNLKGDVEQFGGAVETALIDTGSGANDVLRGMTKAATELIDQYNDLDPAAQSALLAGAAVVGSFALVSGGALGVIGKLAELRATLALTNGSMRATALVAGGVGIALTGVLVAIGLVAQAQAEARAQTEAYASTLEDGTHRITAATRDMVRENLAAKSSWWFLEGDSTFDAAEKLGIDLELVTDAALGSATALRELDNRLQVGEVGSDSFNAALKRTGLSASEYSAAFTTLDQGVRGTSDSIEEATRVAEQKATADRVAAAAADEHADELAVLEGRAAATTDEINELADAIRGFGSATLDSRDAEREFQAAIDDLTGALEANGATLDINTEQGRENQAALDEIAKASLARAAALLEETGSQEVATQAIADGRQALIDQLAQFGIVGQAAEDYADDLGLIPASISTVIDVQTDSAMSKLASLYQALQGNASALASLSNWRPPDFSYNADGAIYVAGGGGNAVKAFAGGGFHEDHIAQIQRSGTYRVWAEPETGGEAYVPLAPSKRGRSEQIMAETASLLGGTYIPGGQSFAGGASPAGSPAGGQFVGQLYLDSGAFIGVVRGAIAQSPKQVYDAAADEKTRRR